MLQLYCISQQFLLLIPYSNSTFSSELFAMTFNFRHRKEIYYVHEIVLYLNESEQQKIGANTSVCPSSPLYFSIVETFTASV